MSSNLLKSRLSIRTGLLIAFFSLLFLIVSALTLFQLSYNDELEKIHKSLFQLAKTMEPSSQVAVYLENKELASEITTGLLGNDNVTGVILHSDGGMLVTKGDITITQGMHLAEHKLYDPFTPSLPIGKLTLIPNEALIQVTARERATSHIVLFGASSTCMVLLVIALVNSLLTKPLNQIANQLHLIKPGSSAKLTIPNGHEHDEIGSLVKDSNQLLDEIKQTFAQKNKLYEEISQLERKFRLLFDNAKVGIALVNLKGELVLHNPSFRSLLGEVAMQHIEEKRNDQVFKNFAESNKIIKAMQSAVVSSNPVSLDITQLREKPHNRYFHCIFSKVEMEGESDYLEIVMYDISERVLQEKKIKRESEVDALTGLLNRRGGIRLIEQKIQRFPETPHAALLIDLDKFKPINDAYGHEAGDQVLKAISQRLLGSVRSTDIVIRWGGDEFLIFFTCENGDTTTVVSNLASKLINSLSEDIAIEEESENVSVGASIGIAIFPEHSRNVEELIAQADSAMYGVKHQGRNNFKIHIPQEFH